MASFTIVLADDHALFRQGLRRILSEAAGLEVKGEASDGLELLKLLNQETSQMIILDISMPQMRGIEAIYEIKTISPATKILILTEHKDREYFRQAMSAGADGYLLKEDGDSELFSAIELIRQGKFYISPKLSDVLKDDWVQMQRGEYKRAYEHLTNREREVLKLVAEGKTSKEIASLLSISVRTVETHRANIMEKLEFKKTADLIKYALKKGFISD
jgi:DNA-binding NarL/FixJ family response regulator